MCVCVCVNNLSVISCDLVHLNKNDSYSPRMLHMQLALTGKQKCLKINGHIHVNSPLAGTDNTLGPNFYININLISLLSSAVSSIKLLFNNFHRNPFLTMP